MLLDFYGQLLTEKQRECCDMYYNEDFSLAEIASLQSISRQGVRDTLVRAELSLRDTEEKLGLLARELEQREILDSMATKLKQLEPLLSDEAKKLALSLTDELTVLSKRLGYGV
jgi:predicted DNA-binding protein YlxM (UPF0122 family)